MVYDLDMLKAFYASFEKKIGRVRAVLQRPLTLAEKNSVYTSFMMMLN